jgi:hypothetical protein
MSFFLNSYSIYNTSSLDSFNDLYWNNVSLLLHGDGIGATPNGQRNNTFLDSSSNNFAITRNGTPSQGSFSPFALNGVAYSPSLHGGSLYVGSTSDYLRLPYDGTTQTWQNWWSQTYFTMECWVYVKEFGSDPYGMGDFYLMNWSTQPALLSNHLAIKADGRLYLYAVGDTNKNATTTSTVQPSTWTHIAFVKNTTSDIAIYVNGVKNSMGTGWITSAQPLTEARLFVPSGTGKCYISGYRTVLGSALYTSNFNPATTITAPPTNISGTGILMNFTNGGIFDNTKKNVLTTVGDAKVSTSVVKYGTGAMYFDGTGDYLTLPASSNFDFGTGDFTVECWINPNQVNTGELGWIQTSDVAGGLKTSYTTGIVVAFRPSAQGIVCNIGGTIYNSSGVLISIGNWYHFAVTRNSGTVNVFLNGTSVSSGTGNTQNLIGQNLCVGGYFNTSYLYNGYIDDLRITKGVARYTANFTPPARAFPDK